MVAPNVTISTGTHPILPELRVKTYQYNLPVTIKDGVWIGAGAIILPGVTIGENSVIGAGSVVTKDIPPNVVAVGCPCRVLREISDYDRAYYRKGMNIDWSAIKSKTNIFRGSEPLFRARSPHVAEKAEGSSAVRLLVGFYRVISP